MIYLDYNATTPVDKRVLEEMSPYFSEKFGNAASRHMFGVEVSKAIKHAREQVASLLHCQAHELIFTSGATEAINLALKGVAFANRSKGQHIVTVSTEHSAVIDTCRFLEEFGYEVTYLPVQSDGILDLEVVADAIRPDTILVSVMYVNNETGVIQPIKEIAALAHDKGALFMSDVTQALGKLPIDPREFGVDLLAFSGHKFYGPKGIGGLYRRSNLELTPLIHGGGHEFGERSGTLNTPLIVGIGKACEIAMQEMEENESQILVMRNTFEEQILCLQDAYINGNETLRLYNTSNIRFKGIDAEDFLIELKEIMVSTGSACTAMVIEPSHVIAAMHGLEAAKESIRFSFGRNNTVTEVADVVYEITRIYNHLKRVR